MSEKDALQSSLTADPRPLGPSPKFDQRKIEYPGLTYEMTPQPDHGEETYQGNSRLKDKVALITGADSGIGRAVSIAFAREGADILLSYLPQEEVDAAQTQKWIERSGRQAVKVPGDITDERYCVQLVDTAIERLGKLDLLVNVAAYQSTHDKLEDFTTAEFDRAFKTNVYALFWLTRAALPKMQPGGSITNTGSIQSYDPSENLLPYAATKAAIVSITKTLSDLTMKRGVRTNAVAPGPVWTPLIPATMPLKKVQEFGKNTAFGRPAQPVEIAPVYVFLASNDARFVTGEVYAISGGQTPY